MRIFGGDSIDGILNKLGLKENESIDHPWINKAMERAQKKLRLETSIYGNFNKV